LLSKSLFGISRTSEQTPEKLFFFNQTEQRQIENNVKYLKSHLACLLWSGWTWLKHNAPNAWQGKKWCIDQLFNIILNFSV
jgi:hypothetical protein